MDKGGSASFRRSGGTSGEIKGVETDQRGDEHLLIAFYRDHGRIVPFLAYAIPMVALCR
jgi:hypothetical protein